MLSRETESSHYDPAIRAANVALTGRRHREPRRITSLELRHTDPRTSVWEVAAMASVAVSAILFVLGIWFL